jgi:hypothetical protein
LLQRNSIEGTAQELSPRRKFRSPKVYVEGHCADPSIPYVKGWIRKRTRFEEHPMVKTIALIALGAALALAPAAALAEQGTSSSYGSVGWGPHIPTQSLTPFDRAWNHLNQSKYKAQARAEWLREHGKSPFPFF